MTAHFTYLSCRGQQLCLPVQQTAANLHVCLCKLQLICVTVQMTALPDRDVVFVRFQNEGTSHSCLPYFIAIDEHSNSVGQLRHAQTDKLPVICTDRHG